MDGNNVRKDDENGQYIYTHLYTQHTPLRSFIYNIYTFTYTTIQLYIQYTPLRSRFLDISPSSTNPGSKPATFEQKSLANPTHSDTLV